MNRMIMNKLIENLEMEKCKLFLELAFLIGLGIVFIRKTIKVLLKKKKVEGQQCLFIFSLTLFLLKRVNILKFYRKEN